MRSARNHAGLAALMGLAALNLWGCATEIPSLVDQAGVPGNVTVGRVLAVNVGRMVAVSIVSDQQEKAQTLNFLHEAYPVLAQQPVEEIRVEPPLSSVRLFEVMPYPRVHRYFRRHWW